MLHVVLGATGGAGRATVSALVEHGLRVRAVSRSGGTFPQGVEVVQADIAQPDAARRACHGAAVVYHCANPPYHLWPQTLLPLVDGVLAGAQDAGARLVVMDNLYMYGRPTGPMTETTPRRATGTKGRLRIQMEERLLEAHIRGTVPVAIGRASDFYGPHTNSHIGVLVIDRVRAGKAATWLGSLDQPHTHSFIEDVGRHLVTLGTRPEAPGEVWHLPAGPPATARTVIRHVYDLVGIDRAMRPMPYPVLWLGGLFDPTIRELRETFYQFNAPFVMDTTMFEETFGSAHTTPLVEGLRRTLGV